MSSGSAAKGTLVYQLNELARHGPTLKEKKLGNWRTWGKPCFGKRLERNAMEENPRGVEMDNYGTDKEGKRVQPRGREFESRKRPRDDTG